MRLTAEEYRRGLIKWNPESGSEVSTQSANGEVSEWSDPLTDANGSIPSTSPGRLAQMRISSPIHEEHGPYPVYWERLSPEGNVLTIVLNGPIGTSSPMKLANIPAYGFFRRIVIQVPPTLQWDEDAVLRVGDVTIRTHSGEIVGEKGADLETIAFDSKGDVVLETGFMGTERRNGRFIEIIADGADHENAALRASAIIGLLGLVFGNSAVAEIVFSEPYRAEPGQPQAGYFEIPNYARQPGSIDAVGLDLVDEALIHFTSDSVMDRAVQLALYWFDRGLRSRTPLDELICYFVGIESILNSFAKVHGPLPKEQVRKSHAKELKALLKGKLDKETRDHLLNSLQHVATRDRFGFYRFNRRLPETWNRTFNDLLDVRNNAFHGNPASVTDKVAGHAKELVTTMLKLELGIDVQLAWEKGPKVSGARLHYVLQK